MASAMPVLPDVASTTVCPDVNAPVRSACSITAIARRSLTDASGLKNSHFTNIAAWLGANRWIRTIGVRPMVPRMLS